MWRGEREDRGRASPSLRLAGGATYQDRGPRRSEFGCWETAQLRCWVGGRDELPRAPSLSVLPLLVFSSHQPNPLTHPVLKPFMVFGVISQKALGGDPLSLR